VIIKQSQAEVTKTDHSLLPMNIMPLVETNKPTNHRTYKRNNQLAEYRTKERTVSIESALRTVTNMKVARTIYNPGCRPH
jgi:hypothetical protein